MFVVLLYLVCLFGYQFVESGKEVKGWDRMGMRWEGAKENAHSTTPCSLASILFWYVRGQWEVKTKGRLSEECGAGCKRNGDGNAAVSSMVKRMWAEERFRG